MSRAMQSILRWILLPVLVFITLSANVPVEARRSSKSSGSVSVRGYYRKDGTYVRPHQRSAPDSSTSNNWSTKGNTNPYTGKEGTKTALPSRSGSDVSVQGYYRSDGTYVAPHMRSAPDGDPSNNWSTKGNINPYTGKEGAEPVYPYAPGLYPSSRPPYPLPSPPASAVERDKQMRLDKAASLKRLGVEVDPGENSWSELNDMEMRVKKAADLKRLGVEVDWRDHTWSKMQDWEMRIRKAADLKRLGIDVDWQQHTWLELYKMETQASAR